MRYWALSLVLKATTQKRLTNQLLKNLSYVLWAGLIVIVAFCLLYSTLMYYGHVEQYLNLIPSFMWILSFIFLADALRRIRGVMNQVKGVLIIMDMFVLYAVLAALAILGQIPVIMVGFFFATKASPHLLAVITIMNNVIIMVFQLLLILILNKLLSTQKPTRFVQSTTEETESIYNSD